MYYFYSEDLLEDSMLGEDDEEDLEALIEACNSQVERPAMNQGPSLSNQRQGQPTRQGSTSTREEFTQQNLSRLLEQQNVLFGIITQQSQQQIEKTNEGSKRKAREEVNYAPQEPVLLLEENYRIEDDAHSKIDTRSRMLL